MSPAAPLPPLVRLRAALARVRPGGRFGRGVAWSSAGTFVSYALALVVSLVAGRLLGREGLGELSIINGTVSAFSIMAGLGLGLTATRFVAEWRAADRVRAGRVVGFVLAAALVSGAALTAVLALAAPGLARSMLAAPSLSRALLLASPLLVANAVQGAQNGVLSGLEAFRTLTRVSLLRGLLNFAGSVAGILAWGVEGAVAGLTVAGLLGCWAGHRAMAEECGRAGVRVHLEGLREELPMLWRFALPSLLSNLLVVPATWVANAEIARLPQGYAEMGVVGATSQWRTALLFLPGVLQQVALPLLSSGSASDEQEEARRRRVIELSHGLVIALVFPATVALMLAAGPLLRLYGPSFDEGAPVAVVMLGVVLVQCVGNTLAPVLQAKSRMWLGFVFNLSWAALMLGVVHFTVEPLRGLASPVSMGVAYVALNVYGLAWLRRDLPPGLLGRASAALALAVGATAGVLAVPAPLRAWLALPAALAVAFVSLRFLVAAEVRARLLALLARRPPPPRDAGALPPVA